MDSLFELAMIFSVIDQATGPVKKFMGTLTDLEKNIQRSQGMIDFGNKMAVSGAMVQGAADQMRGAVSKIVEPVLATNDALINLSTVTTSTMNNMTKSMDLTKSAALEWEKVHRDGAETFISTSYLMASAGLNDIQTIYGTKTALSVATATFGDHQTAANLVATSYNNMGNKARDVQAEMSRLGDILTVTQQVFQIKDLNQLAEGLKYGTPAAIQARISFEELNTVIGQLNNAGLQGSMAGTAFYASVRQMNKASQELGFTIARTADGGMDYIGTLNNLRAKYGDISRASPEVQMAFQKAFGDEGLRAILLLSSKSEELQGNLKKIRYSYGATAQTQSVIEGSDSNDFRVTMNNLRALRREAGEALLPTIKELIPTIRTMIQGFAGFMNAHPGLAKTAVILFAITAGILSIAAPILTVIGMFMMMSGYTMKGTSLLRKFFFGSGKETGKFVSILKKVFPVVRNTFGRAGDFVRILLNIILRVGRFLPTIFTLLRTFGPILAGLATGPIGIVIGVLLILTGIVYLLWKNWDKVKAAGGAALDFLGNKVDAFVGWINKKKESFFNSGRGLITAFGDGIKSIIEQPASLVMTGLQKIRNMLPFSDAKEGPLSTLTKSGRAFIETWQAGVQSSLPGLQDMLWSGMGDTPLALAGAGATYKEPKVNLSGFLKKGSGKSVIIQKLILQVEKIDDKKQFIQMLEDLAEEVADE